MSEIIFKTIGSVEKILKYERPKADEKSNFSAETIALLMPQPGHGICNKFLKIQLTPNS